MPHDRAINDLTLLCERCGYIIEHLPTDSPCPECGAAIAASLPQARTGSAWQQRRGVNSWFQTVAQTLRHPKRSFQVLQLESGRARWFLPINLAAAVLLLEIGPAVLIWVSESVVGRIDVADLLHGTLILNAILAPALYVLLLVLCRIEELGLRLIASRRGWRVSRSTARAICTHASFGWTIGAALAATVSLLISLTHLILDNPSLENTIIIVTAISIAASLFVGMLIFETLVYLGLHQCKFANVPHASAAPNDPSFAPNTHHTDPPVSPA